MHGHPSFNQEKLTKRAKRSVGFVLQVSGYLPLLTSTHVMQDNPRVGVSPGLSYIPLTLCSCWQGCGARWASSKALPSTGVVKETWLCAGRPSVRDPDGVRDAVLCCHAQAAQHHER